MSKSYHYNLILIQVSSSPTCGSYSMSEVQIPVFVEKKRVKMFSLKCFLITEVCGVYCI